MITATPTRITIEVHPAASATSTAHAAPAVVRVLPPGAGETDAGGTAVPVVVRAGEPQGVSVPASYRPAPCTCLDDGGCMADHGND